jgi:hypothetical protein
MSKIKPLMMGFVNKWSLVVNSGLTVSCQKLEKWQLRGHFHQHFILHVAFSYDESFMRSFYVLEVKVKLFIGAKKMAQLHSKNVGEIDSRDSTRF